MCWEGRRRGEEDGEEGTYWEGEEERRWREGYVTEFVDKEEEARLA